MSEIRRDYRLALVDKRTKQVLEEPIILLDEENKFYSLKEIDSYTIKFKNMKSLICALGFDPEQYTITIYPKNYKDNSIIPHIAYSKNKKIVDLFNKKNSEISARNYSFLPYLKSNLDNMDFINFMAENNYIDSKDSKTYQSMYSFMTKELIPLYNKINLSTDDTEKTDLNNALKQKIDDFIYRIQSSGYKMIREIYIGINEYKQIKLYNQFDISRKNGNSRIIIRNRKNNQIVLTIPTDGNFTYLYLIDELTKDKNNEKDMLYSLILRGIDIPNIEDYELTIEDKAGKKIPMLDKTYNDINIEKLSIKDSNLANKESAEYLLIIEQFYKLLEEDLYIENPNHRFIEFLKNKKYINAEDTSYDQDGKKRIKKSIYSILKYYEENLLNLPLSALFEIRNQDINPYIFRYYKTIRNIAIAISHYKNYDHDFMEKIGNFFPPQIKG